MRGKASSRIRNEVSYQMEMNKFVDHPLWKSGDKNGNQNKSIELPRSFKNFSLNNIKYNPSSFKSNLDRESYTYQKEKPGIFDPSDLSNKSLDLYTQHPEGKRQYK